jgi:PAS domain S-box-containing protein
LNEIQSKLPKGSMSKRVIRLLFLFGTVPLLLLCVFFFISFFNIQKANTIQVQHELTQRISTQISANLKKLEAQVALVGKASLPDIAQTQQLEHIASLLLDESLEYDTITVMDRSGSERVKISRYYTFRPFELGTRKNDQAFQETMNGTITYSSVGISPFSKFPTVTLNAPVMDTTGTIAGVLAADLNISKIWHLISDRQIGKGRNAYITDAQGILIAYKDLSSVLSKKNLQHIKCVNDFVHQNKKGTHFFTGLESVSVIGAHSVIEPTGWGVFVETPIKNAFKNFYILSGIFLALSFITLFAAIFFGFRFSVRTIVQPVRMLQKEADNIARGNSNGKLPVADDELGQLAESFNRMVLALNKTTVSRDLLIQEAEERKRTQKQLRDSEEKLRNIVENSTNLFYTHTADHTLTYVSPQCREFLQCEPEEAMTRWVEFATDNPINEAGVQITEEAIRTGKRQPPYELEIKGKLGAVKLVEVREAPILKNGRTVAIVGSLSDISDRKQAEKEKAELQSQLMHAQKMKSIGTLSGGVAHEFNNILSIILGNAEFAMDEISEDHPLHEYLLDIITASLRGRDVVRQLLHFCRKSSKRKEAVDLAMLTDEAIRFLRASIPANIRFMKNYTDNCTPIAANRTQIHQLLINLCNNASHAMEEHGGVLTIGIDQEEIVTRQVFAGQVLLPGQYVKLTVSDTGEGIAPEIIDNIFDPFFTTKDIDKGSGMGLSVVYGIIKDHDGFIRINSSTGEGTTVSCYFTPTRPDPLPDVPSSNLLGYGKEHILILDDEISIATMCAKSLEKLGYTVNIQTNPVEAFQQFQIQSDLFDLIIADMAMPNMTGTQFVQKVRSVRNDIPVIICTGHSPLIDETRAREMGINMLLTKPVERQKLAQAVRQVLDIRP